MSTGPRPPVRVLALVVLLVALGGVAFAVVRRRGVASTVGPAEWPPFEPRLVPAPDVPAPDVPAPDVPAPDVPTWIAPGPNGTVPDSHPIKVKVSSGIFHVPGGRFYERTSADRCYPDAAAAQADGYRPSKS